jgi:hypothetical protein
MEQFLVAEVAVLESVQSLRAVKSFMLAEAVVAVIIAAQNRGDWVEPVVVVQVAMMGHLLRDKPILVAAAAVTAIALATLQTAAQAL